MTNQKNLIRKFHIDVSNLTKNEQAVLKKLEKTAEFIVPIYAQQINDKYPGANFYPHDATKEEILRAAKSDPLILNPYTIVKRNKKGNLEAIPYHIEYAEKLKPIIKLIRETSELTSNKEFNKRLEVQADALENGTYEAADIYWLTMEPYKIDIVIGPIERYDDRLFFKKTSYHANVGVLDEQSTKEGEEIRDAILVSHRKSFSLSQRVEATKRLQVRIDQPLVLAGEFARALFTASFLPNDPNLMEKYGCEVIVYNSAVNDNFEKFYLPIFKKIFEVNFQKSYDKQLLVKAAQKFLLIREISTSFVKYHDTEKRLGESYSVFNEISSHILAVKNAGTLFLKDVISQKELEAIMIILLCRAFSTTLASKDAKLLTHYSQGYAIVINYFLESGALRVQKGISWVNFTKMFLALSDLSSTVEKILAFGDVEDAKRLLNEYGSSTACLKLISKT